MLESSHLALSASGGLWLLIILALHFVIAGVAAIAVYRDAENRQLLVLNLPPLWWAAVTFLSSLAGLLVYWILHFSTLSRANDSNVESQSE